MRIRIGMLEIVDVTASDAIAIIDRYSDDEPPRRKPTPEMLDKMVELVRSDLAPDAALSRPEPGGP